MSSIRRVLALMAGVAVVACADADGVGVDDAALDEATLSADVAMVTAQATLDDVRDMWIGPALIGLGGPGPGHGDGPPGGLGSEIERSRTVTFFDADGVEMDAFDPLLTASIASVLDVTAEREGERWSATMARHREHVVTGLQGRETERTWNGTGTEAVLRTGFDADDRERRYTMDGTVTVSDVVVAVPRRENPWPLSGTITRHVVIEVLNGPQGDRSEQRTAVVTFDGTRYATLEVDGEVFEIDLADHKGKPPRHLGGG